jgi:hypothetical protein
MASQSRIPNSTSPHILVNRSNLDTWGSWIPFFKFTGFFVVPLLLDTFQETNEARCTQTCDVQVGYVRKNENRERKETIKTKNQKSRYKPDCADKMRTFYGLDNPNVDWCSTTHYCPWSDNVLTTAYGQPWTSSSHVTKTYFLACALLSHPMGPTRVTVPLAIRRLEDHIPKKQWFGVCCTTNPLTDCFTDAFFKSMFAFWVVMAVFLRNVGTHLLVHTTSQPIDQ